MHSSCLAVRDFPVLLSFTPKPDFLLFFFYDGVKSNSVFRRKMRFQAIYWEGLEMYGRINTIFN